MTTQKTFKHRVRARMAKTGESYTAARRMLIAAGDRPAAEQPFEPWIAEAKMVEATGRGWQQWFALMDDWGATSRSHTEMARWLVEEHGVPGWWAQSVTVGYERARGLRQPGQRADGGWTVNATKTVAVPVRQLFGAFEDEAVRDRWLPGAELRRRTATAPRNARYDWEDGTTRLVVGFEDLGPGKSRVALQHEKLPDAETSEEMKAWWRDRLGALKSVLESCG